jgi:hypothetical protein
MLVYYNVDAACTDEGVVDPKTTRESGTDLSGRAPYPDSPLDLATPA